MVKSFAKRVELVSVFEPEMRKLSDPELRARKEDLQARISGGADPHELMYEGLALMREAIDRNVGIRNIFNPQFVERFDQSKLSFDMRDAYDKVQAEIDQTLPRTELGCDEQVPGWMQVDIPAALYQAVREIYPKSRPPFRTRPFDVQLIGGMVLFEGKIAEMKTGEGKTIVAPLACFLAVMESLKCHVITVNDYLVQRDRDWVYPAFYKLGITTGAIHPFHMQDERKKQEIYTTDIIYGTNSEFGFDYLRDNMKLAAADQVQKTRQFCIVDEIDSILIDEARTPLIISGPAHDDAPQYAKADGVARQLVTLQRAANIATGKTLGAEGFAAQAANRMKIAEADVQKAIAKFRDLGADFLDEKEADMVGHMQYYVVKREHKAAHMTPLGVEEAQKIVGQRFYVMGNDTAWDHIINQALRAHAVYECDREYVIEDSGEGPEVVIVDEFTGRAMYGRQWSDGLHQAIETKESSRGVKVKKETQTLATITLQNFFKLYERLAGMTGTAITEATEFNEVYSLDVVCIPTNVPVLRLDSDDLIFLTEKAKWNAITDEIKQLSEAGQPVLVGTTSVDKSEMLSQLLTKRYNLEHEVLNAKQHEREANIVEDAGQQRQDKRGRTIGAVTIATNMAGRGTDIKLTDEVLEAGGLSIIGTERHESRRIDNQLRGRAGRQGDPGASRFFISMEDDLMKLFAGKQTMKALSMLGMKEDDAIEHKWITKSVERAQRKVEDRNYEIRKNLLEYDEVMEYQRTAFYQTRQRVLDGANIKGLIFDYIAESIEDAAQLYLSNAYVTEQVADAVRATLGVSVNPSKLRGESLADIEPAIRSAAKSEARQDIEINVGEYMSHDIDPADWDFKGMSSWAMSRYSADLKISRLRDMNPTEVMDSLTEKAHGLLDRKNLEGLDAYFVENYAQRELAEWAKTKFGMELELADLAVQPSETNEAAMQRVADLLYDKADETYRRREIRYPINYMLEWVFGTVQAGGEEAQGQAAAHLIDWAKQRYGVEWTTDDVKQYSGQQLFDQLTELGEKWVGEDLDAWIEQTLEGAPDNETLQARFAERWDEQLTEEQLETEDQAAMLRERALGILRTELTQLEQFVLLQILDQTWKDHLYAMDQLKDSIGLHAFAEKDPKIMYKTEGSQMFTQMISSLRGKVTDMIYTVKLTPQVQMKSVNQNQTASHEGHENTGVDAGSYGGTAEQQADLEAAKRAGGGDEPQKVKTIRKTGQQVGRNDPCTCGSGKKYKKCCGANV